MCGNKSEGGVSSACVWLQSSTLLLFNKQVLGNCVTVRNSKRETIEKSLLLQGRSNKSREFYLASCLFGCQSPCCQNLAGVLIWLLTKKMRLPPPPPPPHNARLFENIMYTLNLCYISLWKTKRHDTSFVCDKQAGTWKGNQPHMIWQRENDERQREERCRDGEKVEGEGGEIDHWVGGNVSVLQAMHFPHVEAAICALFHTSV